MTPDPTHFWPFTLTSEPLLRFLCGMLRLSGSKVSYLAVSRSDRQVTISAYNKHAFLNFTPAAQWTKKFSSVQTFLGHPVLRAFLDKGRQAPSTLNFTGFVQKTGSTSAKKHLVDAGAYIVSIWIDVTEHRLLKGSEDELQNHLIKISSIARQNDL